MAKIEDQRIIVWCNEEEHLKTTLFDAIFLALKFEKDLCLFANYISEKEKISFQHRIKLYAEIVKRDVPELSVSTLLLQGKLSALMFELANNYNTIMFLCGDKVTNYLMKAFYSSRFPFLFSKNRNNHQPSFKRVIIPVDYRKNSKEATLWGSFMGRFVGSDISLLKANDTDEYQQQKVEEIIAFVNKLYRQFSFNFNVLTGKQKSWGIHREALKLSESYDLLILAGSLNVSLIDQLWGSFEKRIINSNSNTPVLLINPQKEMCVLCD